MWSLGAEKKQQQMRKQRGEVKSYSAMLWVNTKK